MVVPFGTSEANRTPKFIAISHVPRRSLDEIIGQGALADAVSLSPLLLVNLVVVLLASSNGGELDALQAEVDALKRLQAETAAELAALLPAILDKAFKGQRLMFWGLGLGKSCSGAAAPRYRIRRVAASIW